MRIFVASLIVLSVLYFWDKDYNNGKLLDGRQHAASHFPQHVSLKHVLICGFDNSLVWGKYRASATCDSLNYSG